MGLDTVLSDLEAEATLPTVYCSACAVNLTQKRWALIVGYAEDNGRDGWPRQLDERGRRISKSSNLVFGANLADQVKMWPTQQQEITKAVIWGKDAERQSEHGHTRCSSAVHRQPTEEW